MSVILHVLPAQELQTFLSATLSQFIQEDETIIPCPNSRCKSSISAFVVPEGPIPFPMLECDDNGDPLRDVAWRHYQNFRLRCYDCNTAFCVNCLATPYHKGLTCAEWSIFKDMRACRYCQRQVTPLNQATSEFIERVRYETKQLARSPSAKSPSSPGHPLDILDGYVSLNLKYTIKGSCFNRLYPFTLHVEFKNDGEMIGAMAWDSCVYGPAQTTPIYAGTWDEADRSLCWLNDWVDKKGVKETNKFYASFGRNRCLSGRFTLLEVMQGNLESEPPEPVGVDCVATLPQWYALGPADGDDVPQMLLRVTEPIGPRLLAVDVSWRWKDQGRGNQSGRIWLNVKRGAEVVAMHKLDDKIVPHDWRNVSVKALASSMHPLFRSARQGDVLEVWCVVGGVGPHERGCLFFSFCGCRLVVTFQHSY